MHNYFVLTTHKSPIWWGGGGGVNKCNNTPSVLILFKIKLNIPRLHTVLPSYCDHKLRPNL